MNLPVIKHGRLENPLRKIQLENHVVSQRETAKFLVTGGYNSVIECMGMYGHVSALWAIFI